MPLLPIRCQIQDDMPMSLGKAIAKAIAPRKVDPIEAFNKGDHREFKDPAMPFFGFDLIDEADCKQIKGAALDSTPAEKAGTTQSSPEAAPPSAKYSVGQQWLCRDGSTAEVLQVTDYGHSRASDGWRDGCGRRTSGLNGPRDFVELIPTPDAEGWVLVTMDAPALKARQYDWKYTNRNGGTEVTPAADVSAPLRDGNLERFAQAGTYFYRVAP